MVTNSVVRLDDCSEWVVHNIAQTDPEINQYMIDQIDQSIDYSNRMIALFDNKQNQLTGEVVWQMYNLLKELEVISQLTLDMYPETGECLYEGVPIPNMTGSLTIKRLLSKREQRVQERLAILMLEVYIRNHYEFVTAARKYVDKK